MEEDLSSFIVLPFSGFEPFIIPNLATDQTVNISDDKVFRNIEYIFSQSPVEDVSNQEEMVCNEPKSNLDRYFESTSEMVIECPICKTSFPDQSQYLTHYSTHHEAPIYQCMKCEQTFDNQKSHHKHLWTHLEEKQFNCTKCGSAFNYEVNFKIHMALHEQLLTCPICNLLFQRTASLRSHLAVHQVEEFHTCYRCYAEFENLEDLKKHMKKHIQEQDEQSKNLVCNYCKVKFNSPNVLREHVSCHMKVKKLVYKNKKVKKSSTHSGDNKHKCSVCSKSFPKVSLLERHFRIHSGERPFKCMICSKGFSQKVTLNHHLTKHAALKPFHCTLCPASFNQKTNLKVHVMKTHTANVEGEKSFKCLHCSCIFKRISSLNSHMTKFHVMNNDEITVMAVVDQLKNLSDLISKKTSVGEIKDTSNREINTVQNQIAEENPTQRLEEEVREVYSLKQKWIGNTKVYVCFFCNKESKKPSDIVRHMKSHSKEKSFECFCGKSFSMKTNLVAHMTLHNKKIERKCPHCLKSFHSSKGFNVHMRKFNGSCSDNTDQNMENTKELVMDAEWKENNEIICKNYKCDICPASFNKETSLKNHILLHSRSNSHQCSICSRVFVSAGCLKKHMKIHLDGDGYSETAPGRSLLKKRISNTSSKIKPYECPYCKKKFRSMMICRKHIDIHRKLYEDNIEEVHEAGQDDQLCTVLRIDPNSLITDDTDARMNLNNEKVSTSPKTLKLFGNQGSQTILLDCSEIQGVDILNQCLLSQLELQPNGTVVVNTDDLDNSPVVFNLQNIVTNVENTVDNQLLRSIIPEKSPSVISPSPNSLLKKNFDFASNMEEQDLSDNFLTDSISLYPNTEISFDSPPELNSNPIDVAESLLSEQNLPTFNDEADLNPINESQNEDTNIDYNLIQCATCKTLYSDITSHKCSQSLQDVEKTVPPVVEAKVPESNNLNEQIKKKKKKRAVQFNCVYCGKDFNNRALYILHVNTHKENGDKHTCKYCDKQFKKPSDLQRHLRTHTGEKPFACDKCERKFSLKSTLESHYRTHDPGATKDFLCEVCNSFFSSKSSRKLHMSIHVGMKPFKCNYCDQHFRTSAHKRNHEQKSHINNAGKKNQSKQKKIQQMLSSVAEIASSNLAEDLQNAVAQETTNLKDLQPLQLESPVDTNLKLPETLQVDHSLLQQLQGYGILIHDLDDEVLQSSVTEVNDSAPQTFDSLELIQGSFDVNSEEADKHFECDICHKKSASKDSLRKHVQLHSKKKFVCEQCNKWFTSAEDLSEHEKLHFGYRPFSCFLCANSFAELQHLKSHLTRIHQIMDTNSSVIQFSTGESLFI